MTTLAGRRGACGGDQIARQVKELGDEAKHSQNDPGAFALPMAVEVNPRRVRTRFWRKFWRVAGRIPFAEDAAAAYYCARDPATPTRVKGVLLAALAYFIAPMDLVPDFVVGLGFGDDATVLATAIGVVGAHIRERHRAAARALMARPTPQPEAAFANDAAMLEPETRSPR